MAKSKQVSMSKARMAGEELATAAAAGQVARAAAKVGVAKIATGAEATGMGEATGAAGEILAARAVK